MDARAQDPRLDPTRAPALARLVANVADGIVPPATRTCPTIAPGHAVSLTGVKLALGAVTRRPSSGVAVTLAGVDGSTVTLAPVDVAAGPRGPIAVRCHDADVLARSVADGGVLTLVPEVHVLLVPSTGAPEGTEYLGADGRLTAHAVTFPGEPFTPCPRSERLDAAGPHER